MMYENFLCLWLLWLLFIIVFFFMKKGIRRNCLAGWLLLIISLSDSYVGLGDVQLSIAIVVIAIGSVIYFVETALTPLKLFRAFTVMISYSALLMWAKLAPVWFFIPAYLLIPILIVAFVLVTQRQNAAETYSFILFGMTFGQLFFDYLLYRYHLQNMIGSTESFIFIGLTVLLLYFFQTIIDTIQYMSHYVQKKII